ncbi:TonB-dependent receptor [Candidatus Halobeggiatoa sp. HSG11]|nr:TonB-dependent receptor [Candidatus Halobeggiatoa sp. HSG11]
MRKIIKVVLTTITCISLFLLNFVHAQNNTAMNMLDDTDLLNELSFLRLEMVSIATGTKQSISRVPAATTVITASEIEKIGAAYLDEILETVPGLHVARSNIGYNPIYTFRGIYSNFNPQVLMLINGISIDTLYAGNRGQTFGSMPVNAIARIEIMRGPGSAVFGADAFAGVINIITKNNIEDAEIGMRLGSFNTQDWWILQGGKIGGVDVALALEYHITDGQRAIIETDGQTAFDTMFGTKASLAPGAVNLSRRNFDARIDVAKDKWQLRLGYQGRQDFGMGAGGNQALDPNGRFADDRVSADLTYHNPQLTKNWDVTAQLSHLQTKWRTTQNLWLYPPGSFGGAYPDGMIGNPGLTEDIARFNISGFYKGLQKHTLRLGTGFYYGDLHDVQWVANNGIEPTTGQMLPPGSPLINFSNTPYTFLKEGTRKNWHVFFQDIWTITDVWELTTGLRYDHYSDFGTTLNPRIALVWQTNAALTTKLLYGRAFRAPSFLEQYGLNNPVAQGNPTLKPETIEMWELAFVHQSTDKLLLSFNSFYYKWQEAIRFVPDLLTDTSTAQNIGSQTGYGFEIEAKWILSNNISLLGNYAYQRAKDEDADHDAGNSPHHQIYFCTNWQFLPHWHLNTQLNWVADRKRVFNDFRPDIDDNITVDLTLHRTDFKKDWNFSIAVRNLLNEDVREPSLGPDRMGIIAIPNDLPQAGRHYFLKLLYKF